MGDEKGYSFIKLKMKMETHLLMKAILKFHIAYFPYLMTIFSYNFLDDENNRLNAAYSALQSNINALGTVPIMPDEDGGN